MSNSSKKKMKMTTSDFDELTSSSPAPRRTASASTANGRLQANSAENVKTEQLSTLRRARSDGAALNGAVNGRVNGKRREVSVGEEDEEEEEESEKEAPLPDTKRKGKIRALSTDGEQEADEESEAASVVEDEGSDAGRGSQAIRARSASLQPDSQEDSSSPKKRKRTIADEALEQRGGDGFLPGAIVRVALSHFVTYDAVEFYPGPHLNMIIGPNGTGKSTVVCAIALGLGWKPNVLGRARDVAAFVKQGYEDGWIEIELKGAEGERNVVIRREIVKRANTSEWYINGTRSTAKEVNDCVEDFNIKIGNLCSFLPQDKVADFARMAPPQLLKETQKAAGDERLPKWHNKLIDLGKTYRELVEKLEAEEEESQHLEERNAVLERDVRRYEERRRIENRIELLSLRIPFAQYGEAKKLYDERKKLRDLRKAELEQAQRQNEPLERKREEMKDLQVKMELRRKRVSTSVDQHVKDLKKVTGAIEKAEEATADLYSKLKSIKAAEQERKKAMDKLRKEIAFLEQQVANEPELRDTTDLDRRLRAVKENQRRVLGDNADTRRQMEEVSLEGRTVRATKDDTLKRLKELDNVRTQRLNLLKDADPDCFNAVQWLRENPGLFEKRIYDPVMIELGIKDPKYASAVESCINWQLMRTFVCQTRKDYDIMTRELVDKRKLRLNVVELEGAKQLDDHQPPVSAEQLERFGFEGYAIDLIDGPEAILNYLCSSAFLHAIPISLNEASVDLSAVERSRAFKRYIIGKSNHTVTYSSYGSRLPQTMSRDLRPARTFATSVNATLKAQLDTAMKEADTKVKDLEKRVALLEKEEKEQKAKTERLKREKDDIETEKADAQRARAAWEKAKLDLVTRRDRLRAEESRPSPEGESHHLRVKLKKAAEKRASLAQDSKAYLIGYLKQRARFDVATLECLQHSANLGAMEQLCRERNGIYEDAQRALEEAVKLWQEAKADATQLHKQAQAKIDTVEPEVMAAFRDMQNQEGATDATVAELQDQLAAEQAALDFAQGVHPGVINAFKARQRQIEELKERIASKLREKAKLDYRITENKNKWLPALQELVDRVSEKFSAAFDRIGCAGEVRLSQDEDYDKWGIDILVKFRDNEQLQLLTGQRQSGGERSLSTILYLMSLTELSRSPFSLVDEINQGMDPRAERAVHDQMVEVTCRPDASQYFLITPKLLPDLRFHERMKVLIINNGEWLPEKFKFDHYIQARKRRRDGAGPSRKAIAT